MTMLGLNLEERVKELQQKKQEEKMDKLQKMLDKAFQRFELLVNYPEDDAENRASNRVKILIKNLFDNRQSGWAKSQK